MKYVVIILSLALLLCLAPMPYGYYQIVRFAAMLVFAVLAYQKWNKDKQSFAVTFGALALLFQPFVKIALGRVIWNLVDLVVAITLILILIKDKSNKGNV